MLYIACRVLALMPCSATATQLKVAALNEFVRMVHISLQMLAYVWAQTFERFTYVRVQNLRRFTFED